MVGMKNRWAKPILLLTFTLEFGQISPKDVMLDAGQVLGPQCSLLFGCAFTGTFDEVWYATAVYKTPRKVRAIATC